MTHRVIGCTIRLVDFFPLAPAARNQGRIVMAFRSLLSYVDISKLSKEELQRVLSDLRKLRDEAEDRRDDAARDLDRIAERIQEVRDELKKKS